MRMLALMILLATGLSAQEGNHKFFDTPAKLSLGVSAATFATDGAITCRYLGQGIWREGILPTQSCAGIATALGADFAAQTSAAYFLHRRGHHRLERLVEMFGATGSGIGITWNLTHKPIHPAPITQPVDQAQPTQPLGIPCGTGCQM